jgi:hypothetical protein
MWALRRHLQDVHVQELEDRKKNRRAWKWISRRLREIMPTKPAHIPEKRPRGVSAVH